MWGAEKEQPWGELGRRGCKVPALSQWRVAQSLHPAAWQEGPAESRTVTGRRLAGLGAPGT